MTGNGRLRARPPGELVSISITAHAKESLEHITDVMNESSEIDCASNLLNFVARLPEEIIAEIRNSNVLITIADPDAVFRPKSE